MYPPSTSRSERYGPPSVGKGRAVEPDVGVELSLGQANGGLDHAALGDVGRGRSDRRPVVLVRTHVLRIDAEPAMVHDQIRVNAPLPQRQALCRGGGDDLAEPADAHGIDVPEPPTDAHAAVPEAGDQPFDQTGDLLVAGVVTGVDGAVRRVGRPFAADTM